MKKSIRTKSIYIKKGSEYEKKFLEIVKYHIDGPLTIQVRDRCSYDDLYRYTLNADDMDRVKGLMRK